MIQEHIQLLRYAPRAHVPHSACIERLPAIACMLAQTPAALVRRWVYRACSIRGVNTDNCPRYLAVQTSSGLFGEPRPFMPDHASLGLPADPRPCHGARRWNGRSAVAQRRTADGQTGRLAGGDHAGSARRCAPAARGAATRARALPNLFPQPSRDGPLSPVGGMAGLRRLGGRRRTGGRADWQAVAIICRGGALGGRQFCHASARPHNPPLNSRRGPAVVCRWDNWSASARRRATNTQTGRSGGGACDLPRRWCARLCLFLRYRLQETAGCRAFK